MTTQQAQQNEAENKPVTATWRDRDWTVPSTDDWPWDVLEAIDDEKFTIALRGLLSDEDYAAFKQFKPTVNDGAGLLEALAKAAGMESTGE